MVIRSVCISKQRQSLCGVACAIHLLFGLIVIACAQITESKMERKISELSGTVRWGFTFLLVGTPFDMVHYFTWHNLGSFPHALSTNR